jgi:hypothetical protein
MVETMIKNILLSALMLAITLLAAHAAGPSSLAQAPAQIIISPATAEVYAGGIGSTGIQLQTDLVVSSLTFQLQFDPAIISVLDADLESSGVQIALNSQLAAQGVAVLRNRADNNAGTIEIELAGLDEFDTLSPLATITWWGRQEGIATISLSEASLTSPNQQAVFPEGQDGVIEVTAAPGDPIIGRVLLEGQNVHDETTIYLSRTECPNHDAIGQTVIGGEPVAMTGGRGYFEIIPEDGVIYRCLQAVQRGYLNAEQINPQGNLGTIILPGGDVNDDDEINIFDLALIGSRYGDTDGAAPADINRDGTINIFDLVLAANNYGEIGPVDDWR